MRKFFVHRTVLSLFVSGNFNWIILIDAIQLADACFEVRKAENPPTFDGGNTINATHRTHKSLQQWIQVR